MDNVLTCHPTLYISFFPTFDGNRAALYDLYEQNAMFSVSVNAGLPKHRQKSGGPFVNSGAPTDWRDISRNLTKVKSLSMLFFLKRE